MQAQESRSALSGSWPAADWRAPVARLLALLTLCCALAPDARALDFTVQSMTLREDNISHVQLYFQYDPANVVYIQPPRTWKLEGNPSYVEATAPAAPECAVRLQISALAPAVPFTAAGLDAYRRAAIQQVPSAAAKTQIAAEKADPLPVFSWQDYEFTLSYELFGQQFSKSVIFIDLDPKQQLLVTCTAPRDKFASFRAGCDELLRSWQVMPRK